MRRIAAGEPIIRCGVVIDAPDARILIRALHNLMHNPNFGGEAMIVSLGCEKLSVERLMPPGSHPAQSKGPYVVSLQDESLVGFEAMVEAIMRMAEGRLARLDARRRQTCPASDLRVALECGGQPGRGPCRRHAGARRGRRVFFRSDRSARRHRPARGPRRHPRDGRGPDPRNGLV